MPQGKRKTAEEILGIQAPRKSAEEILGVSTPPPPLAPAPAPGFLENLRIGASEGFDNYILNPAVALTEALSAAAQGDARPLREIAELAGRGLIKIAAPIVTSTGGVPRVSYDVAGAIQDPQIAAAKARQTTRREKEGGVVADYFRGQKVSAAEREALAAQDPSLSGKITRGVAQGAVAALPAIATGIATGGSAPAIAGITALQSAAEPESLALNVAAASIPIPVGRAVAPILRRLRGGREGLIAPAAEASTGRAAEVLAAGPAVERETILESLASQGGKVRELQARANFEAPGGLEAQSGLLVASAEKTPVLETISALRKAGLLTGVKTHIRNIAGTGMFQLGEEVARVPAVVADLAASAITNRRTVSGPSLSSIARSGYEAATKGIREAGQILRKGISEEDIARLQLAPELNSGSKVIDAYANTVFRTLNAEDRVIRTYALRRALEDRAKSKALTEVKQGAIAQGKFAQRFRELLESPPEDMAANAAADAEIAVFTNENIVSRGLGAGKEELKKIPGGKLANFAIDIAAPFTKTPTNIIARMLDYSPVGFGKNVYQAAKGVAKQAFTEEEQRAFAQTFGRASVGSALMALGWKLYDKGLMTGTDEDDLSKRTRDQAAGRIPGAIKVGNVWHQVTGFSPLGTLMAMGASFAREYEQERPTGESALPALGGVALNAIGEQPLLEAAETLTRPGSVAEKAGGFAGSFVPTMVSDVAELIDPVQRQTQGQGVLGGIEKRVPGLRQVLPPAADTLGRPREDRASQFFDPTRSTAANQSPVVEELVRLDAGLTKLQKGVGESQQAYQSRVQDFGKVYETYGLQLLNSPQYQEASDVAKKKAFASFGERVKVQVREEAEKGRRAGRRELRLNPNEIMRAVNAGMKRK